MPNELELERQLQIVKEIFTKSEDGKVKWTVTDKTFISSVGPLTLSIFRNQASAWKWSTMNVALDGSEFFTIQNSKNPSLVKTSRMTSEQYKACVQLVSELVDRFEKKERDQKFSKTLDVLTAL